MGDEGGMKAQGPCWVLVGPTASGKSAVALEIGRSRPVEIVSVDSMMVYRGMDVGTAKPSPREREIVPHHMIDVLDPSEGCNMGWFCRAAREAMEGVWGRGHVALLVGGTALYLKGILWGVMEGPGQEPETRRRLERELAEKGAEAMHRRQIGRAHV